MADSHSSNTSALFAPFKATGVVCSGDQLSMNSLGDAVFLTTSIGKSFVVYDMQKLQLSLVSRPLPFYISHVSCFKETTFAATQAGIAVFRRARCIRYLKWSDAGISNEQPSPVCALMVIGEVLLSLHSNGILRLWNHRLSCMEDTEPTTSTTTPSSFLIKTIDLRPTAGAFSNTPHFVPTCLLHPDTYLNKIVVGTSTGSALIVNVRTGAIIHECRIAGENISPITCLTQSPAVDVIAAGLADGRVKVYNLRTDEEVCTFSHSKSNTNPSSSSSTSTSTIINAASSVTSIAFSFGDALSSPALVSCTESGSMAFWNLETRTLQHLVPAAHDAGIVFVSFLPKQACVITAGGDNALRVWQVDRLDGTPRLLKSRSGHVAPPRFIRYYGGTSATEVGGGADARVCEIASAGTDRMLRMFHTALDRQNCELSQGHVQSRAKELGVHPSTLRLPPITSIAVSDRRQAQWADVVTAHTGDSRAYCWSWDSKRLEDRVLVMPNPRETVTSVAISSCGHFALVGGASGTVAKFNLQSGGRKGTYPKDGRIQNSFNAKGKKRSNNLFSEDFGALDRDTGRGFYDGLGQLGAGGGPSVDNVDTTLALAMGIMPTARLPASAAITAPLASSSSSSSLSVTSNGALAQRNSSSSTASSVVVEQQRHVAAIYGVASDLLNSTVISCDATGLVCFWDFETHDPLGKALKLPSACASLVLSRDSGLAAIACDDFVVRVVDVSTRRQVRSFAGHSNRITDMCYSPDGRWLVTSSLDRSIRVWDLSTARCVDWMNFESAPVSVTFSPTSEYLVTAHADSLALYMWANKAHFGYVVLESAISAPTEMSLPRVSASEISEKDQDQDHDQDQEEEEEAGADTEKSEATENGKRPRVEEKNRHLLSSSESSSSTLAQVGCVKSKTGCHVTLSGLPQAAWVNLDKLDMIFERNKPTEPAKKPEAAPFFLPTVGGVNPVFVAPTTNIINSSNNNTGNSKSKITVEAVRNTEAGNEEEDGDNELDAAAWEGPSGGDAIVKQQSKATPAVSMQVNGRLLMSRGARAARSVLASLLRQNVDSLLPSIAIQTSMDIAAHLASLSPVSLDVEFRSLCLGPEDDDGIALLCLLLKYLKEELREGRAYDLTQAHLGLVLNIYGDIIAVVPALRSAAKAVKKAHGVDAKRLQNMVDSALCLVGSYLGQ